MLKVQLSFYNEKCRVVFIRGGFASIVQKGYIIILYILYFSLEFGALEMSFQELNGTFLNNCSARSSVQITVRKYKLSNMAPLCQSLKI